MDTLATLDRKARSLCQQKAVRCYSSVGTTGEDNIGTDDRNRGKNGSGYLLNIELKPCTTLSSDPMYPALRIMGAALEKVLPAA